MLIKMLRQARSKYLSTIVHSACEISFFGLKLDFTAGKVSVNPFSTAVPFWGQTA